MDEACSLDWKLNMSTTFLEFLKDRIDPDFGLLDKLLKGRILSREEIDEIKVQSTYRKRNLKLIDYISTKNAQDEFASALRDANQSHLVNYLIANGENEDLFDGDWPLRDREITILDDNQEALVELLDTYDLLNLLFSSNVINYRQRNFVTSKSTSHEKNEALFDILRRRSINDFRRTMKCLVDSNQSHIAEMLDEGGVLVRVHAEGLHDKTEDEIIAAFKRILKNKSPEERRRFLEVIELDVITAEKGESVVLYVYCKTVYQLIQLKEMNIRGKLRKAVQCLFIKLLTPVQSIQVAVESPRISVQSILDLQCQHSEIEGVTVTLSEEEYGRCRSYFPGSIKLRSGEMKDDYWSEGDQLIREEDKHKLERKSQITEEEYKTSEESNQEVNLKEVASKTSISDLPFELLDSILLKAYLEGVLGNRQALKNKDYYVINQIASVDCCWFQRIIKRKFKKEVWRRLAGFYRKQEKSTSIYRINRNYFEENIRLQGLVNRLKSYDCLTDVQIASLYRQDRALGKKDIFKRFMNLISDVLKKIDAIHSVFRRCLWDTKQQLIDEVLENGGAMAKVEINFQKAKTSVETRYQNLELVEKINEIQDIMKTRSNSMKELMVKLKEEDLEILNANQDGDVIVVWIWCKTKCALGKLQTLNKSKHIINVFTEVVKGLSFSSEEQNPALIIQKVNIDFEQFEKTVVIFSIIANFTSNLDIEVRMTKDEVSESVWGLTKLGNKIHVLLRRSSAPRCVILVFEDQIPFPLQRQIEIKQIKFPTVIVSIETENSLYVLDPIGRCIWKINEEGHGKRRNQKVIRWLELKDYSETLSVTGDEQKLLLFGRTVGFFWNLSIFGGGGDSEKAEIRRSIPLPEDIQYPRHAVETSKGNFIISHRITRKKEVESGSAEERRQMKEELEEEMEEEMWVVSEVSGDGNTILRRFIPEREEHELSLSSVFSGHLAVDSLDRVFLTDYHNDRVILFDSDLQWKEILIPTEEDRKERRRIQRPQRLFYDEEKNELIVGGMFDVFVYTLNRK